MKRKPLFKKTTLYSLLMQMKFVMLLSIQDKEILDDFGADEVYYSAIISLEDYMNKSKYHSYIKTHRLTLATDQEIINKVNKIRMFS